MSSPQLPQPEQGNAGVITTASNGERRMVSMVACPAGTIILDLEPYAAVVNDSGTDAVCAGTFRPFHREFETPEPETSFACSRCKSVRCVPTLSHADAAT